MTVSAEGSGLYGKVQGPWTAQWRFLRGTLSHLSCAPGTGAPARTPYFTGQYRVRGTNPYWHARSTDGCRPEPYKVLRTPYCRPEYPHKHRYLAVRWVTLTVVSQCRLASPPSKPDREVPNLACLPSPPPMVSVSFEQRRLLSKSSSRSVPFKFPGEPDTRDPGHRLIRVSQRETFPRHNSKRLAGPPISRPSQSLIGHGKKVNKKKLGWG